MSAENEIKVAGDVQVKGVIMTSLSGAVLDITDVCSRVEIFEDIYSPFLTMNISVIDSIGIAEKMPIIGEEYLTVNITDATGNGLINKEFYVYKVKDRVEVADRSISYVLCCISVQAIVDMNLKISRSFSDKPENIVKQLVKEMSIGNLVTTIAEESKNSVQFISNYWSPIQIIKFLCDRAVSKASASPSYIFFESLEGFRFVSMDALVSQPSSHAYVHSVKKDNDIAAGLSRIHKIHIDEDFDYIRRIHTGMYGNRLLTVDPFNKSYDMRYLDISYQQEKQSRLNPKALFTENATRRLNSNFEFRVAPSVAFQKMPFEGTGQWLQQRKIELSLRDAQSIQIDVAGSFKLAVGQIIDAYIYSTAPKNAQASERDLYSLLDNVYSGRYIISASKHVITRHSGHQMYLTISKDSLITPTQ